MGYKVLFKEEANHDILLAFDWYESKRMNLGEEVEEYLNLLGSNPKIFRPRNHNWRYCPIKRFPYVIVYEIEQNDVIVYSVFNTYQHPNRLDPKVY